MTAEPPIDLRQDRDFGEVFNATFAFVKQNIVVLVKSILFFVAPVLVVSAIFLGDYLSNVFSAMGQIEANPEAVLALLPSMALGMLFTLFAWMVVQLVVMGVLKLHEERGPGQFEPIDALRTGFRYFWPLLGLQAVLVVGFVVSAFLNIIPCLGTLLWIVGMVYVGVRVSLASYALVLDDLSITDALKKSWELVGQDFWQTFGVLLVMWILAGILAYVFQIPVFVYTMTQTLTNLEDPAAAFQDGLPLWVRAMMVVSQVAQYLLYVLPVVAGGIQYGNLSETVGQTGLVDRVRAFGVGPSEAGQEGV